MENKGLELCPGHGREVCAMCCWPKGFQGDEISFIALDEFDFDAFDKALADNPLAENEAAQTLLARASRFIMDDPDNEAAVMAAIGDALLTGVGTYSVSGTENTIEIRHVDNGNGQAFFDPAQVVWQEPEPKPQYTAVDMATAAAEGFRDGKASVAELLNLAYRAGWDESAEGWNAEYPGDGHERKHWTEKRDKAIEAIIAAGGSVKE